MTVIMIMTKVMSETKIIIIAIMIIIIANMIIIIAIIIIIIAIMIILIAIMIIIIAIMAIIIAIIIVIIAIMIIIMTMTITMTICLDLEIRSYSLKYCIKCIAIVTLLPDHDYHHLPRLQCTSLTHT